MEVSELERKYYDIKRRYDYNLKVTKISRILRQVGGIIFISSFVLLFLLPTILSLQIASYIFILMYFLGLIIIIISKGIEKKRNKLAPKPPLNELLFLEIFEAIQNLKSYVSENIEFQKVEAVKCLKKLSTSLTRIFQREYPLRWLELTEGCTEQANLLKELITNFQRKLIPAIESSQQKDLDRYLKILENLALYFLSPNIKTLKELNVQISKIPVEVQYYYDASKIRQLYLVIKRYRNLLLLISLFLVPIVIFFIGTQILQTPNEIAFLASVTGFGGYATLVSQLIRR